MRPAAASLAAAVLLLACGCSAAQAGSPPSPSSVQNTPGARPTAQVQPTRQPTPSRHLAVRVASWTLPVALSREVVIDQGGTGLVAGGLAAGDVSRDQVLRVDPGRGTVQRLSSLVTPVHDSSGVLLGGRPLVVGGGGATELSDVQAMGGDRRWRRVGSLPSPRSDLATVAVPGGLLVIGGYDGARSPREILRSRDGRTFTEAGRLQQPVRYAATAVLGGYVYELGGEQDGRELRTVQRIDVRSGAVRVLGQLPTALGHAGVAVLGSRLLLMGGRTAPDRPTDRMEWVDPTSARVTPAGVLPYAVADAGVLTVGATVYLLGGETPSFTNRVIEVSAP